MFTVKVILKSKDDKNTTRLGNDILPLHKADDLDFNKYIYIYLGLYQKTFKITDPQTVRKRWTE